MGSRDRLLAAMRREAVDYVPLQVPFAPLLPGVRKLPAIGPEHLRWHDEPGRLRTFDMLGIDKSVDVHSGFSRSPEVRERVWQTQEDGSPYPLLHKEFQTPAGPLSAVIKRTDDWPWGDDIPFCDDFSPSRYAKPWITDLEDVERLRYVLQPARGAERDGAAQSYRKARALGQAYDAIVGAGGCTGLDFVCWLCGFEQAVLFALEQPAIVDGLLDLAANIYLPNVELLCELGVDYIERRGWYESADYWSPALYRRFARPLLEREVALVHGFGRPVNYIMQSGIMPLLPQLAEIPFDGARIDGARARWARPAPDRASVGRQEVVHGRYQRSDASASGHARPGTPGRARGFRGVRSSRLYPGVLGRSPSLLSLGEHRSHDRRVEETESEECLNDGFS